MSLQFLLFKCMSGESEHPTQAVLHQTTEIKGAISKIQKKTIIAFLVLQVPLPHSPKKTKLTQKHLFSSVSNSFSFEKTLFLLPNKKTTTLHRHQPPPDDAQRTGHLGHSQNPQESHVAHGTRRGILARKEAEWRNPKARALGCFFFFFGFFGWWFLSYIVMFFFHGFFWSFF